MLVGSHVVIDHFDDDGDSMFVYEREPIAGFPFSRRDPKYMLLLGGSHGAWEYEIIS